MFPNGVQEAIKTAEETEKANAESLGEAKQFSYIEHVQLVKTK